MTTTDHQAWLPYGEPRPGARTHLFCFPHAGAGASAFRDWRGALGRDIDVLPVQMPGRGARIDEPAHLDMADLVRDAAEGLKPWLESETAPYAFLGHSMGALVAFELAHRLREQGAPGPQQLFLSGHRAPQLRWPGYTGDAMSREEVVALVATLGGPAGTEERLLSDAVLPVLQADFTLCARYRHRPRPPLAVPLTVLGGAEDPLVPRSALQAWQEHTTGGFRSAVLPGGHFYLFEVEEVVASVVESRIRAHRPAAAAATGAGTAQTAATTATAATAKSTTHSTTAPTAPTREDEAR